MMDKFMDCICDNDLTGLIIPPYQPSPEELKSTWDKIYVQFCQVSQGESYNEVLEVSREINDLSSKINLVNGIVQHLSICFDAELIKILNSYALLCDIKKEDTGDDLIKKLNMVVARAKKWEIELSIAQKRFDALQAKATVKMDRDHFDDQIDELSTYKKYQIEASKITVALFYKGLSKMHKEYERQQMKHLRVV